MGKNKIFNLKTYILRLTLTCSTPHYGTGRRHTLGPFVVSSGGGGRSLLLLFLLLPLLLSHFHFARIVRRLPWAVFAAEATVLGT